LRYEITWTKRRVEELSQELELADDEDVVAWLLKNPPTRDDPGWRVVEDDADTIEPTDVAPDGGVCRDDPWGPWEEGA
jgi:hypothetical protein